MTREMFEHLIQNHLAVIRGNKVRLTTFGKVVFLELRARRGERVG